MEEHGLSEEEAQDQFDNVKTMVMLQAQEMDKGWSDETVNAITNLIFAIQQAQVEAQKQARSRSRVQFYGKLYRTITAGIRYSFLAVGVHFILAGMTLVGGAFIAVGLAFLLVYLKNG